jgi:hypothetical protein
MIRPQPARFSPSAHGFAFMNSWPSAPAVSIPTPLGSIGIGNAASGLCGGMVFAALDYWQAQVLPPVSQPAPGTPLYQFIVRRLIDSWRIPAGVAEYYQWMNLPDGDASLTVFGRSVVSQRGLARRTIEEEWPGVRASLDAGVPAALGLVTVASANPAQLGRNHQALACGYQVAGTEVTVQVYDPNRGQDDGVCIQFDTADSTAATAFRHNLNIGYPVRGFFLTAYSPVMPPGTAGSGTAVRSAGASRLTPVVRPAPTVRPAG